MTVTWMLQTLSVGILLSVAAMATHQVAQWFALPRRAVWGVAMVGSLLLPMLSLWIPGLFPDLRIIPNSFVGITIFDPNALPYGTGISDPSSSGLSLASETAGADLALAVGMIWLSVSLIILGAITWTYRRLCAVCADCVPMAVDGAVIHLSDRTGPAVVGLFRPVVVIPRWVLDASAEEKRLILQHEREHVHARDPGLLLAGALAVALMPWNLPLWWQFGRLRLSVETDCDARVLARGASRRAYGRALLHTAGGIRSMPLLGPAWGASTSHLERRILAMTTKPPKYRLLRSLPLAALALGGIAAACDALRTTGVDEGSHPATVASAITQTSNAMSQDSEMIEMRFTSAPQAGSSGFTYRYSVPANSIKDRLLPEHMPEYPEVSSIVDGSSPQKAGLQVGDIILSVDGRDARAPRLFPDLAPGTQYTLGVRRNGEELQVPIEIGPPQRERRHV